MTVITIIVILYLVYIVRDILPLDFFLGVLLLFQFEYVLVEVNLQILVGVIDAQLFETVFLKHVNMDGKERGRAKPNRLESIVIISLPSRRQQPRRRYLEVFETEYVQDRYGRRLFGPFVHDVVDPGHEPREQ